MYGWSEQSRRRFEFMGGGFKIRIKLKDFSAMNFEQTHNRETLRLNLKHHDDSVHGVSLVVIGLEGH